MGCGRYSNKHSVAHFEKSGHPYSLELATLRIWDYRLGEHGGFVHRSDLLECPSSPPLLYPWMNRGIGLEDSRNFSSARNRNRSIKSDQSRSIYRSKKALMVADEYEALLQSALEDQATFFEAEITRLRGDFTSSLVNQNTMMPEDIREIEALKHDIGITKKNIEDASKRLLEAQGQEVGLRAASHQLLSEQQECNEIIKKIQEEHRKENERGKIRIEDLEQTIADLGANLSMQEQFSLSNEFSNASIGFISAPESKKSVGSRRKERKKGKKAHSVR